ncbi:MAG: class I SAM-dependent methyltransferase [Pseudomonadota bacterium]
MSGDFRDTLLLPFENGTLAGPQPGVAGSERWLGVNISDWPASASEWGDVLICVQSARGASLDLSAQGFQTSPDWQSALEKAPDGGFQGALIMPSRARRLNEANFARAWNATRIGGVIAFAGDKTSGVQSMRKWVGKQANIAGTLSKNHAQVFWAMRTGDALSVPDIRDPIDQFETDAGMFSAGKIDPGSRLLADMFDHRITGKVADLGAGWGYLSHRLLAASPNVEACHLYEHDHASLQAAQRNVSDPRAQFHWCDIPREVASGPPERPFDWVIMNPPFHTTRAADPSLGQAFLKAAAGALPKGGRMLMVANRNLPYERLLSELFTRTELRADQAGYKVIFAVR